MLQWLKRLDPDCASTLAQLRTDAVAYLVPIGQGEKEEARAFVDTHYSRFFAQELATWELDAGRWPAERTPNQ